MEGLQNLISRCRISDTDFALLPVWEIHYIYTLRHLAVMKPVFPSCTALTKIVVMVIKFTF